MLYIIGHFLRDKMPWLWDFVDIVNSWLFNLRFGSKLGKIEAEVLQHYDKMCGMKIVPISNVPTDGLVSFFAAQPAESFTFFKPHRFDAKSLKKLQKNKAFLAYVLLDDSQIVAYCFIRSFFIGKGFRGRLVGIDHRGRGLGTLMNRLMNDIGFGIGLRLFETVSKKNVASYRSAISASDVKVIKEFENDELYIEIVNNNDL